MVKKFKMKELKQISITRTNTHSEDCTVHKVCYKVDSNVSGSKNSIWRNLVDPIFLTSLYMTSVD